MQNIPYDVVLTLRLLLLRNKEKEKWKIFKTLQSSLDEWKKMTPWEENQEEKLDIIQNKLGLKSEFSREEILQVQKMTKCWNLRYSFLSPA